MGNEEKVLSSKFTDPQRTHVALKPFAANISMTTAVSTAAHSVRLLPQYFRNNISETVNVNAEYIFRHTHDLTQTCRRQAAAAAAQ